MCNKGYHNVSCVDIAKYAGVSTGLIYQYFTDKKDIADFYYSLDGKKWTKIGSQLKMAYTLPHFMGYRFGLFNYATKTPGGYVDFDYFRISDSK